MDIDFTGYYDRNAEKYVAATVGVDMAGLYEKFLPHIPEKGRILDAGCESGRDSRAFLQAGYSVLSIDGSREMVRRASLYIGQAAEPMRFEELEFENEFDRIWACAFLLHVAGAELPGVLGRFARALKPGGVWLLSFKLGRGEETWLNCLVRRTARGLRSSQ